MLNGVLLKLAQRIGNTRAASRIIEGLDLRSDNRLRERGMLAQAFEFMKINNVSGDYFEFGLWRGKTFLYAHEMKRRYHCEKMRLWGFDSFQGLPPIDDCRENIWQAGQFACSERDFRQILRRAGVREDEYELVAGYYEHSLKSSGLRDRLSGNSAAIIYIDCDLYTSAKQALDFVKRYLVNGSILCFDNYHNYKASPTQGERRALTEFLAQYDDVDFIDWFDYSPLGKSFIAQLRSRSVYRR